MNKKLFVFLSLTWGLPITLVGLVAGLLLKLLNFNTIHWKNCICFESNNNFGLSLGLICIVPKGCKDYLKDHEYGHSVQNCIFGPFTPLLVHIPSAIRFWYREYLLRVKKVPLDSLPGYYDIWFEKTASTLGKIL